MMRWADQLKQISASTIDRSLGREKRIRHLRRNRNPNVQRLIYQKVPVKVAADWDTSEIGNVQVDFVAHCGRSTGGDYIHTISAVDIAEHRNRASVSLRKLRGAPLEPDDSVRLGIWQRPQQHGVYYDEDGRVGADDQRER